MLKRIAANNPEFHKGHSQLAELLVAGQAAACVTCYAHHYPVRKRKGAPVDYMLTEGTGDIDATAILKAAPHPNTALLFARWTASEEGQKVFAQGGRLPAHPKVEPVEKTRPAKVYPVGEQDVKDYPKYEKMWKEIFGCGEELWGWRSQDGEAEAVRRFGPRRAPPLALFLRARKAASTAVFTRQLEI